MKHLINFFEKIEIIDNLQYIIDSLGEPEISKDNWGDYEILFKLNIDLYEPTNVKEFVSYLKSIVSDIDDLLSMSKNMEKFDIKVSFSSSHLVISLVNRNKNYKFLKEKANVIIFDSDSVFNFFKTNKIGVSLSQASDRISIYIFGSSNYIFDDFINMLKAQSKSIEITRTTNGITLTSIKKIQVMEKGF
jgi:hypothetical protein